MNLLLRPSIMFHSEQLNIGANFTYERKTEKIEYTQIETNTSKTIFSLYGLWFYTSEVYASGGDNSRQKDDNTFGGAAQVELLFGDFKFYNEFTGLYKKGTQSETGYNNKQFGDIEQTMYRYDGALSYNNAHRLKGYVAFSKMLGYKLLQRSELSPDAALYLWITYNRINSYVRNATNYEISYTFHRARTAWNNSWELSAGARGYNVGNAYMMYPLKYSQTWNYTEAFASFNKNLRWKTGMIDIFPTVAYGVGSGTENEVTQYDDSNILEPDVPWQLNAQLAAEYAFMTADRLNAGLKVRYSYFLNKTKGWDIYGDLCYNYTQALSGTLKNNHRQNVSLTVGFSF